MNCTEIDLNQVVTRQEKALRRLLGERATVTLACSPLPARVCADEGMMAQVLVGLALHGSATRPELHQVTIATEHAVVDAAYVQLHPGARSGEFVRLTVQTSVAAMPELAGRRLTLPVITGIVQRRHGWVELCNHETSTTFCCYLPQASRGEAGEASWCDERVLLVEDEPEMREMLGMILRRASYRVVEAEDGVQALALWPEERAAVTLLITDMVMPGGVNGRELAQRLRASKPELKILYTSGYELATDARQDCERGAVTFLQKPYEARMLLETVQQILTPTALCPA